MREQTSVIFIGEKMKNEKCYISADALMCCCFALVWVRENISSEDSLSVVHELLKTLEENKYISSDTLFADMKNPEFWDGCRDSTLQYMPVEDKKLDKSVLSPLLQELERLENLLSDRKTEQAYALADAIHLLPEIILKNDGRITQDYYDVYLEPYRKKWNVSA